VNQHVGVGLGLMLGFDEVLKHANAEPFFGPLLGSALKPFYLKNLFCICLSPQMTFAFAFFYSYLPLPRGAGQEE
jgi:hypothetical protein